MIGGKFIRFLNFVLVNKFGYELVLLFWKYIGILYYFEYFNIFYFFYLQLSKNLLFW